MNQFLIGPFGDEAIAALIGAILAAIVAIWLQYVARKRPCQILCREILLSGLVQRGMVGDSRPRLMHGDRELKQPWLLRFHVTNAGADPIVSPVLTFTSKGNFLILAPTYEIKPRRSVEQVQVEMLDESRQLNIGFEYVNSFPLHKEVVYIDLILDGDIGPVEVTGAGVGWSVRQIPLDAIEKTGARYLLAGFTTGLCGLAVLLGLLLISAISNPVAQESFGTLWAQSEIRLGVTAFAFSLLLVFFIGLLGQAQTGFPVYRNFVATMLNLFKWLVSVAGKRMHGHE